MTAPRLRAVGGDRVFVRDLVRTVGVGILASERGVTQRVRFTVTLDLGEGIAPEGDEPAVSYVDIVEAIDAETAGHSPLLEQLAERVAGRLLANSRVARADLVIEKLDILKGEGILGVHMVRERAA